MLLGRTRIADRFPCLYTILTRSTPARQPRQLIISKRSKQRPIRERGLWKGECTVGGRGSWPGKEAREGGISRHLQGYTTLAFSCGSNGKVGFEHISRVASSVRE